MASTGSPLTSALSIFPDVAVDVWSEEEVIEWLRAWLAVIDHTSIANRGTNTHSQIDSHISSTSNPHSVTKAQVGLTNVTDDAQVKASIGTTKGDLITFTASATPARLAVGTDTHVLTADSSTATGLKWAAVGGGGTPGGSDTQIQFNDSSAFGGATGFTWNKTTSILTVPSISFALKNQTGGTIYKGQPVTFDNDGVKLCQANVSPGRTCIGVVADVSIAAGATGNILVYGPITIADWTTPLGSANLTSDRPYYISLSSGVIVTPEPASGAVFLVGTAISTTTLFVHPRGIA